MRSDTSRYVKEVLGTRGVVVEYVSTTGRVTSRDCRVACVIFRGSSACSQIAQKMAGSNIHTSKTIRHGLEMQFQFSVHAQFLLAGTTFSVFGTRINVSTAGSRPACHGCEELEAVERLRRGDEPPRRLAWYPRFRRGLREQPAPRRVRRLGLQTC